MAGSEAVQDGRRRRRVPDERILAAALAEFARGGYGGASMAAVAERAGTTKPTLYTNFGAKDELFAATVAAEADRLRAALLGTYAAAADRPLREQLHAGTLAIFTYAAERPDGFELLFGAATGVAAADATLRETREAVIAAVGTLVAPRLGSSDGGRRAATHARLLATMLVGLLEATARTAVADGVDPATAAALAESLVLDGLTGLDVGLLRDV